jgi:hypothetical protein
MAAKVLDKSGKVNLDTALTQTVTILEKISADKDKLITAIENADNEKLKTEISAISDRDSVKNGNNLDEKDVVVGNKGIKFYIDETSDKTTFDVFEVTFDNGQDGESGIKVSDKTELEKICNGVIKVCNAIAATHDRKEKGDKRVEKTLDKFSKDKTDKEAAKKARVVRELLRANSKFSYLPEKLAISGCHTALAYVNKCLRQYGK